VTISLGMVARNGAAFIHTPISTSTTTST